MSNEAWAGAGAGVGRVGGGVNTSVLSPPVACAPLRCLRCTHLRHQPLCASLPTPRSALANDMLRSYDGLVAGLVGSGYPVR